MKKLYLLLGILFIFISCQNNFSQSTSKTDEKTGNLTINLSSPRTISPVSDNFDIFSNIKDWTFTFTRTDADGYEPIKVEKNIDNDKDGNFSFNLPNGVYNIYIEGCYTETSDDDANSQNLTFCGTKTDVKVGVQTEPISITVSVKKTADGKGTFSYKIDFSKWVDSILETTDQSVINGKIEGTVSLEKVGNASNFDYSFTINDGSAKDNLIIESSQAEIPSGMYGLFITGYLKKTEATTSAETQIQYPIFLTDNLIEIADNLTTTFEYTIPAIDKVKTYYANNTENTENNGLFSDAPMGLNPLLDVISKLSTDIEYVNVTVDTDFPVIYADKLKNLCDLNKNVYITSSTQKISIQNGQIFVEEITNDTTTDTEPSPVLKLTAETPTELNFADARNSIIQLEKNVCIVGTSNLYVNAIQFTEANVKNYILSPFAKGFSTEKLITVTDPSSEHENIYYGIRKVYPNPNQKNYSSYIMPTIAVKFGLEVPDNYITATNTYNNVTNTCKLAPGNEEFTLETVDVSKNTEVTLTTNIPAATNFYWLDSSYNIVATSLFFKFDLKDDYVSSSGGYCKLVFYGIATDDLGNIAVSPISLTIKLNTTESHFVMWKGPVVTNEDGTTTGTGTISVAEYAELNDITTSNSFKISTVIENFNNDSSGYLSDFKFAPDLSLITLEVDPQNGTPILNKQSYDFDCYVNYAIFSSSFSDIKGSCKIAINTDNIFVISIPESDSSLKEIVVYKGSSTPATFIADEKVSIDVTALFSTFSSITPKNICATDTTLYIAFSVSEEQSGSSALCVAKYDLQKSTLQGVYKLKTMGVLPNVNANVTDMIVKNGKLYVIVGQPNFHSSFSPMEYMMCGAIYSIPESTAVTELANLTAEVENESGLIFPIYKSGKLNTTDSTTTIVEEYVNVTENYSSSNKTQTSIYYPIKIIAIKEDVIYIANDGSRKSTDNSDEDGVLKLDTNDDTLSAEILGSGYFTYSVDNLGSGFVKK